jgi:hypothetical protein
MEDTFDDILQPIRTGKLKPREALRPYASIKPPKDNFIGVLTPKKGVNQINVRNLASGKLQNDLKSRLIEETAFLQSNLDTNNHFALDDSVIFEDPGGKQSFADYVQEETTLNRSQQTLTALASSRNESREGSYKQTAGDVFVESMSQKLQKEFLSMSNPRFRLTSPIRPRLVTMAQRAGSFFNRTSGDSCCQCCHVTNWVSFN